MTETTDSSGGLNGDGTIMMNDDDDDLDYLCSTVKCHCASMVLYIVLHNENESEMFPVYC